MPKYKLSQMIQTSKGSRKKILSAVLLASLALCFAGCGQAAENAGSENTVAEAENGAETSLDFGETMQEEEGTEEAAKAGEETDMADDGTAETDEEADKAGEETDKVDEQGHFTFQPIVISSIFRDIMGEDMCEAYGNYVEAALKGENEFAVKDAETYDWMIGQFPPVSFPILEEYTDSDYGSAYHDGKATFHYTIPKSEFAKREKAFEEIVTGILNETMRDDYSDFEKVLALYEYFCEEYTYDYDVYEELSDRYIEELSAYRFLTTEHGICGECAPAFSYLLLQAGVDATTVGGICPRNGEGHAWSYITINGKNYHVDPTYGMSSGVYLSYLMMTDEQREEEDGYEKSDMCVACHYKDEHNGDQYDADDDYFAPLWGGYLTSWDHEKKLIYYMDSSGNDAVFDYSSFE